MNYDLWNDGNAIHLIESSNKTEKESLGANAELVHTFTAGDYTQAKEMMMDLLYGGESSTLGPSAEAAEDAFDPPQSWGMLSNYLELMADDHQADLLLSSLPESHFGTPVSIMSWIAGHESYLINEIKQRVHSMSSGFSPSEELNEKVTQLVAMRVRAACDFIDSIHVSTKCIIPYPKVEFPSVLEWLLVHWWDHVGLMSFSRKVHSLITQKS